MSQHSFSIANESGILFRGDVNSGLQSLASNSSGATAPATTYPYMFWVDSSGSSPALKVRNGANNAWVTMGPLDQGGLGVTTYASGASPPSSPVAFQSWFDTTTGAVWKIRNSLNTAWIVVGDATLANLGLLPLTGGTLSGPLLSTNTDHWQVPRGTTGQRTGSPATGMFRYNTTLSTFEGYSSSGWGAVGGSGGASGSLEWTEGATSPTPLIEYNQEVYAYEAGAGQSLYTIIRVPTTVPVSKSLVLKTSLYSPDTSGTVLLQAVATLIRPGTDAVNSTLNQRTSTNTALTLTSTLVPQSVSFDLTDTAGAINSILIAAGNYIQVAITRAADTATSDVRFQFQNSEVTFQ